MVPRFFFIDLKIYVKFVIKITLPLVSPFRRSLTSAPASG